MFAMVYLGPGMIDPHPTQYPQPHAAKRRDLHGAVMMHGGYEAVAAALGRRVTWSVSRRLVGGPPEQLRRELEAAAEELDLPAGAAVVVWTGAGSRVSYGGLACVFGCVCGGGDREQQAGWGSGVSGTTHALRAAVD